MNLILEAFSYDEIMKQPKGLRNYLKQFLVAVLSITQMFTTGDYSIERKQALRKLWHDLKKRDIKMYRFLRYRSYNTFINFLPWHLKGWITTKIYLYLAKKIKLG